MAKKETTTAPENNAQSQDTTLDTTFENWKKGNLISQSVNEKALEEIAKYKEEYQIRIAKNAIKELYKSGAFRGDAKLVKTKDVVEGNAVVATAKYTPSKNTKPGSYIAFGIENA